jgi:hypothetical protein
MREEAHRWNVFLCRSVLDVGRQAEGDFSRTLPDGRSIDLDFLCPRTNVSCLDGERDFSTFINQVILKRLHYLFGIFSIPVANVVQHLIDVIYKLLGQYEICGDAAQARFGTSPGG